jgi:hypothetical protein
MSTSAAYHLSAKITYFWGSTAMGITGPHTANCTCDWLCTSGTLRTKLPAVNSLVHSDFHHFWPFTSSKYCSKLCTLLSDRIDQLFRILIFKQCHWNVELTQALSTYTLLCIVDMLFGNATSNETHRGLFSVVICRRINLGCWEWYVYLFIKCCLHQ